MPRAAKLCRHLGYWYTKAGSVNGVYFGRVDEVSFKDANQQFRTYLASLKEERSQRRLPIRSVAEMCDAHLQWIQQNRSEALLRQRKCLLNQWCNHVVGEWNGQRLAGHGDKLGRLRALLVSRTHLEQYLLHRRTTPTKRTGQPPGDKALRAMVIALKACWNWAAESVEDGGGEFLPTDQRPFAKVSRGVVQIKDLTEADLPTETEIEHLFKWAAVDMSKIRDDSGKYRSRTAGEFHPHASWQVFEDLLRVYHATGARTSELCHALVRDFMPRTQQLCLGRHKRSTTLNNPTVRNIQLGTDIVQILVRNVDGKSAEAPLFTCRTGAAWTQNHVNSRMRHVRRVAELHGDCVRDHITPYSFRDLYISELLMIGIPTFQVAKMAGTSLREIERTYGHFFNHNLAEAQAKLDAARKERAEVSQRNGKS